MSEAVRLLWDLVAPGWDMVWIARPGIHEAEFSELQSACARLLRRARLLKTDGEANVRMGPPRAVYEIARAGCEAPLWGRPCPGSVGDRPEQGVGSPIRQGKGERT